MLPSPVSLGGGVPEHKHPSDLAQLQADLTTLQGQLQALVLTANSVNALHLAPDSVGTSEIQTNGVGTLELTDLSVTNAKLAANAVTDAKVLNVSGSKIIDDSITTAKYQGPRGMPASPTPFFKKLFTDFGPVVFPSVSDLTTNVDVPGGRRYIIWAKSLVTMTVGAASANANTTFGIAIDASAYEQIYYMDDVPTTASYNETVEGWCEWVPAAGNYDVTLTAASSGIGGAQVTFLGTASGGYNRPRYLAIIDIGDA